MRKNLLVLGLFSCLALAQIAAPISMIARREVVLRDGAQYRFRTAPVDPYDAFRGRYVALAMEENKAPVPSGVKLGYGQKVYAHIEQDDQGFAKISRVTMERPSGDAYLAVHVRRVRKDHVSLSMPFDRYYMEEKAAPAAEAAYRKHSTRESKNAYVTVRIKNGFAVLEELYVDGKPISEMIK